MCHFRYTSHKECGHYKRTRLSTCLASIKHPEHKVLDKCNCKACYRFRERSWRHRRPSPACSAISEGSDQILFSVEGLCPQCDRDHRLKQEKVKWRHIWVERNYAIGELFEILGDRTPTAHTETDQMSNIDGKVLSTISRFYINNILVETLQDFHGAEEIFQELWQKTKKEYIEEEKKMDPKWTSPRTSTSMEGLKKAYHAWVEASRKYLKENEESKKIKKEIQAQNGRIVNIKYKKYKTDPPKSKRYKLPFTDTVTPKPKSKLRNEVKVEDLLMEEMRGLGLKD